jgi:hypothetical protein
MNIKNAAGKMPVAFSFLEKYILFQKELFAE